MESLTATAVKAEAELTSSALAKPSLSSLLSGIFPIEIEGCQLIVDQQPDGTFYPYILEFGTPIWSGACESDRLKAEDEVVLAYNQLKDTFPCPQIQMVSPDLLRAHPVNRQIYVAIDSNALRLKDKLDVEDPVLVRLTVETSGLILSGNSRWMAVQLINQECKRQGKPPKFPVIEVEVCEFDNYADSILQLLIRNDYRVQKTPKEQYLEAELYKEAYKAKRKAHKESGSSEPFPSSVEIHAAAAQVAGISPGGLSNLGTAMKQIGRVKEIDPELGQALEDLTETKSPRAARQVSNISALALEVLGEEVEEGSPRAIKLMKALVKKFNAPGRPKNVSAATLLEQIGQEEKEKAAKQAEKKAAKELHKEEAIATDTDDGDYLDVDYQVVTDKEPLALEPGKDSDTEPKEELDLDFAGALEAGASVSDGWLAPELLTYQATEVMGHIDLDPFAELEQLSVPATHHYTVFDDGLVKPWGDNVFAYVPTSKVVAAFKKVDEEIQFGRIKQLFMIVEAEAQSLNHISCQSIAKENDFVICTCFNKLGVKPSAFLRHQAPKTAQKKESKYFVCYYWSEDPEKKDDFVSIMREMGSILYPVAIAPAPDEDDPNFLSLAKVRDLAWEQDEKNRSVFTAVLVGYELRIEESAPNSWSVSIDGEGKIDLLDSEADAKRMAIAYAVEALVADSAPL